MKEDKKSSSIWEKMVTYSLQSMPRTKPGARQNCVTDVSDSQISIQIAAPAQEGKANSELIQVLASIIFVRKSSVSIDHGHRSREKRVRLVKVLVKFLWVQSCFVLRMRETTCSA